MADQTFTITDGLKTGILDVTAHADKKLGNAAGSDFFIMPNDGKTVLVVVGGASAKAITFTAVANRYGRTETLVVSPTVSKTSIIGPFRPHLFNTDGAVKFKPATSGDVGDTYLALRVG